MPANKIFDSNWSKEIQKHLYFTWQYLEYNSLSLKFEIHLKCAVAY